MQLWKLSMVFAVAFKKPPALDPRLSPLSTMSIASALNSVVLMVV
jgi:hypothetical protein